MNNQDSLKLLADGNRHIEDSLINLEICQNSGQEILIELSEQKTVLEKIKDNLARLNQSLSRGRHKIEKISETLCVSKWALYASIVFILLALILTIWLAFFPPWVHPPVTNTTLSAFNRSSSPFLFYPHNQPIRFR